MPSGVEHSTLTGGELHYSKIQSTNLALVTPSYTGQSIFDTNTYTLYIAKNINNPSDWIPIGNSGGVTSVVDTSSTSYTVLGTSNMGVVRLTSTSARDVTLPTSPVNGFTVTLQDAGGNSFTNNITVSAAGGNTFQGGGTTYKIFSDRASVTFTYDSGLTEWLVRSSYEGFDPQVKSLNNFLGSDLTIQTLDTNDILFNVDGNNAISIGDTDIEIKKVLSIDDSTDNTKQIAFAMSGATTGTKTILNAVQTANRILTFPDITDTLVSKASTDILTNKSFNNTTTMLAANQLNFNNSDNTFYTSLKAGANAANLNMTLPTTAPAAGQVLYSSDTAGTLGWVSVNEVSFAQYTTAGAINNLPSSTNLVELSSSVTGPLNGIAPGENGQLLTVLNNSSGTINITYGSGSAVANGLISYPNYTASVYNLPLSSVATFVYYKPTIGTGYWYMTDAMFGRQIQGSVLGSPFTGCIGEQISSFVPTYSFTSNNDWFAFTTIDLTAGVWDLSSMISVTPNVAPFNLFSHIGATTSSSISLPADAVPGNNFAYQNITLSGGTLVIPVFRVEITSTTTYYMNIQIASSQLINNIGGRISATRVG